MKKALPFLLLLSPSLAAAAPMTAAQLDGFYSGDAALPASVSEIKAVPAPGTPTAVDAVIGWLNPAELARKEREALDAYGRQPYGDQQFMLEEAMAILMNTGSGAAMCRASMPEGCGFHRFTRYNIEIRVKDLPDAHAETPAYFIGSKKVITFDTKMFNGAYGAGDVAAVLAHELSHVQDVAKYQAALPEARLATEKKAFMTGLAVYSEIYEMDRPMVTDQTGMQVFMHAWRRKFEGGPNVEITDKGKKIRLDDYLARIMPGNVDTDQFVTAMTKHYYQEWATFITGPNTKRVSAELLAKTEARAAEYGKWRVDNGLHQQYHYPGLVTLPPGPMAPAPHSPYTPHPSYVPPLPPNGGNNWPTTPPAQPQQPANPKPPAVTPPQQPPANPKPPVVQPPPPPPPADDDPPPNDDGGVVDIGPGNPLYPH